MRGNGPSNKPCAVLQIARKQATARDKKSQVKLQETALTLPATCQVGGYRLDGCQVLLSTHLLSIKNNQFF